MRHAFISAIAALAAVLPLRSAEAGGIVIHYRELAASAAARGVEPIALPSSSGQDPNSSTLTEATTPSSGGASSPGTPGGGSPTVPRPPGLPGPLPLSGVVVTQPADDSTSSGNSSGGTISAHTKLATEESYEDFGDEGCGGATAARGPVELLPFAVAGLALLRRRR